jgi:Flp pilus assembly protein TadD
MRAAVALAAVVAVSFTVPTAALQAAEETNALCSRAAAFFAASNVAGAEQAAREALEREPRSARARFILGAAVESAGRTAEAEMEYRKALDADPAQAGAAANLAAILVRKGRPGEAVPILKRALETNPGNELCWRNLVVALATAGDGAGARETAASAARAGVRLDPGLLRRIGAAGPAGR